jgi:hypothetical protein
MDETPRCAWTVRPFRSRAEIMTQTTPKRDIELVWLPKGAKASGDDFAKGEPWPTLEDAIIHARETVRADRHVAWIRCDKKFLLSPEDIVNAYGDVKRRD